MPKEKNQFSANGFTIVELLVVIMILAILIVAALAILNPIAQINKVKDSQRRQDLNQIRNALDNYYNDHGCYPQPIQIQFGFPWQEGDTVYMKKLPQDPDCANTGYCYIYQTETTSNCPQWNVVYARLQTLAAQDLFDSCPMKALCGSVSGKYNYCIVSGSLSCNYINGHPLPVPFAPTDTPTPTPTPTMTLTPTPTPVPGVDCCDSNGICKYWYEDPTTHFCNITNLRDKCTFANPEATYVCYQACDYMQLCNH